MSTRIDYLNPTGGTASYWYEPGRIENIIANNLLTPEAINELIKQMAMNAGISIAEAKKTYDDLFPQTEIKTTNAQLDTFSSYSTRSRESYFSACKIWARERYRYENMEDFVGTYFGLQNGILKISLSTFKKYLRDAYDAGIIHKDNSGRFIP